MFAHTYFIMAVYIHKHGYIPVSNVNTCMCTHAYTFQYMCVYIIFYMHVCIYSCIYIYTHMQVYGLHVCTYTCAYRQYIYICMCMYAYSTHICMCRCVLYTCIHRCTRIQCVKRVYVHTTCVHMYTYMHVCRYCVHKEGGAKVGL